MIRYRVFPEQKLISLHPEGEVTFDELVAWHFEITRDPNYANTFDGIMNQRYATLLLEPEDMTAMIKLNKKHHFALGRWVHLIDTPMETALAMLYKKHPELDHDMAHFISNESASAYLGYDIAPFLFDPTTAGRWIISGEKSSLPNTA